MENLLILGAGGFGRMVAELAAESGAYEQISFLDDAGTDPRVLGRLEEYPKYRRTYRQAMVALGNNALRLAWVEKLAEAGYQLPPFVFRPAWLSPSAFLGEGCFVLPGAVINTGAQVGRAALINCGAVVDHEAVIGDGAHICLHAVVKSGCCVADCVKLEAGCVAGRIQSAK